MKSAARVCALWLALAHVWASSGAHRRDAAPFGTGAPRALRIDAVPEGSEHDSDSASISLGSGSGAHSQHDIVLQSVSGSWAEDVVERTLRQMAESRGIVLDDAYRPFRSTPSQHGGHRADADHATQINYADASRRNVSPNRVASRPSQLNASGLPAQDSATRLRRSTYNSAHGQSKPTDDDNVVDGGMSENTEHQYYHVRDYELNSESDSTIHGYNYVSLAPRYAGQVIDVASLHTRQTRARIHQVDMDDVYTDFAHDRWIPPDLEEGIHERADREVVRVALGSLQGENLATDDINGAVSPSSSERMYTSMDVLPQLRLSNIEEPLHVEQPFDHGRIVASRFMQYTSRNNAPECTDSDCTDDEETEVARTSKEFKLLERLFGIQYQSQRGRLALDIVQMWQRTPKPRTSFLTYYLACLSESPGRALNATLFEYYQAVEMLYGGVEKHLRSALIGLLITPGPTVRHPNTFEIVLEAAGVPPNQTLLSVIDAFALFEREVQFCLSYAALLGATSNPSAIKSAPASVFGPLFGPDIFVPAHQDEYHVSLQTYAAHVYAVKILLMSKHARVFENSLVKVAQMYADMSLTRVSGPRRCPAFITHPRILDGLAVMHIRDCIAAYVEYVRDGGSFARLAAEAERRFWLPRTLPNALWGDPELAVRFRALGVLRRQTNLLTFSAFVFTLRSHVGIVKARQRIQRHWMARTLTWLFPIEHDAYTFDSVASVAHELSLELGCSLVAAETAALEIYQLSNVASSMVGASRDELVVITLLSAALALGVSNLDAVVGRNVIEFLLPNTALSSKDAVRLALMGGVCRSIQRSPRETYELLAMLGLHNMAEGIAEAAHALFGETPKAVGYIPFVALLMDMGIKSSRDLTRDRLLSWLLPLQAANDESDMRDFLALAAPHSIAPVPLALAVLAVQAVPTIRTETRPLLDRVFMRVAPRETNLVALCGAMARMGFPADYIDIFGRVVKDGPVGGLEDEETRVRLMARAMFETLNRRRAAVSKERIARITL